MFSRFQRDDRGAAAIEMALVLPILTIFIFGIFQVGAIFAANAIMQGALGEGARYATIWPVHTDAEIKSRIESKVVNIYTGTFTVSNPVTTSVAAASATAASGSTAATPAVAAVRKTVVQISYSVTPNFIFFTLPALNITRSKTAYMSVEAAT